MKFQLVWYSVRMDCVSKLHFTKLLTLETDTDLFTLARNQQAHDLAKEARLQWVQRLRSLKE